MELASIPYGSPLGHTLLSAHFRERFAPIAAVIQHTTGHLDFNAAPEAGMHGAEDLLLLAPGALRRLGAAPTVASTV